jgi:hypothetical protein
MKNIITSCQKKSYGLSFRTNASALNLFQEPALNSFQGSNPVASVILSSSQDLPPLGAQASRLSQGQPRHTESTSASIATANPSPPSS